MEKTIMLFSYAKINLSIDVGDVMKNGMHPVDMVMQQISLRDEIIIRFTDEITAEAIDSFEVNPDGFQNLHKEENSGCCWYGRRKWKCSGNNARTKCYVGAGAFSGRTL